MDVVMKFGPILGGRTETETEMLQMIDLRVLGALIGI